MHEVGPSVDREGRVLVEAVDAAAALRDGHPDRALPEQHLATGARAGAQLRALHIFNVSGTLDKL